MYSAIDGLAGKPKARGSILLGRVLWEEMYRTRLQLVPPFANRCSCPKGGACRHVVTLGLTYLHQERQRADAAYAPSDECTFYEVACLEEDCLRSLVLELLATLSGATKVATEFLARAAREGTGD